MALKVKLNLNNTPELTPDIMNARHNGSIEPFILASMEGIDYKARPSTLFTSTGNTVPSLTAIPSIDAIYAPDNESTLRQYILVLEGRIADLIDRVAVLEDL